MGCTKSKHNPGVSVGAMAPLGVHSNRQRASMGNMAISRFAASTNSIVWLYNNTGKSILAGILFHAMINVSEFSFPNYGSYYNPLISTIIFATVAAIVVFLGSPKTSSDIGLVDFALRMKGRTSTRACMKSYDNLQSAESITGCFQLYRS